MVRIMIMATMLLMTRTTMRLLRMLNQCTLPPGMFRYASQRDAQLMSDSSQYTSKVYTILASAVSAYTALVALPGQLERHAATHLASQTHSSD